MIKKTLATFSLLAASLAVSNADIIVAFDVQGTGTSNNTGYLPGTVDPSVTSTGLGRTGVTWTTAGNSFNSNNWNITNTFNENNNYISFTITPTSAITFTDLQYAMNGSNTAPATQEWGYSIGGGAFTLSGDLSITNPTVTSLATWDFADFTTSAPVEFRFWAYGTTSINGGTAAVGGTTRIANIAGNDLVVNGIIPEPTSAAILGLGIFGTGLFFRRRRNAA